MYLIETDKTRITKLQKRRFSDLGITERNHLQEWLANNPQSLGEDLLIIQKEFQGFNNTNERLDLLALDKKGNLVIIENKIDDSGKDVTWQALKYASYCSSLSKEEIKNIFQVYLNKTSKGDNAEELLGEFLEKGFDELTLNSGNTQRIIMVAGKFRKEVTSTVVWLLNYNIRLQCFEANLFALDDRWFATIDQILPVSQMEDFTIRMADKTQDNIISQETSKNMEVIRFDFWSDFIKESKKINQLFNNTTPSRDMWIGLGIGISGVSINLVVSKLYARAEIYINKGEKEINKRVFDFYKQHQLTIENTFGHDLQWERMSDKVTSRIQYQLNLVNVTEKSDWPKMIDFLVYSSAKMKQVFEAYSKKLSAHLKE